MAGNYNNVLLQSSVYSENEMLSLPEETTYHMASQSVDLLSKAAKKSHNEESLNELTVSRYLSVDEEAKQLPLSAKVLKKLHKEGLKKRGYRLSSKVLGQGAFGTAYKVYPLDDPNQELACKIMLLQKEKVSEKANITSVHSFTNEVQVMQACSSHENIVSIWGHFIDEEEDLVHGYIIMDFASLGSLHTKLINFGPFSENTSLDYFEQMASAIEHMHQRGIAHRDLTLANVLLSSRGDREVVKLSDFGLSRKVYSKESGLILLNRPAGTFSYMAPELIECYLLYKTGHKKDIRPYNCFQVDIWALGVCLYMMLCKVNPFQENKHESVTGDYSFYSLLSCHFQTLQSEYEEMQSLPNNGPSDGKKAQIALAKEMLEKQISGQWLVPQSISLICSESTLFLLQRLLTFNPQERINISQTFILLRKSSISV